MHYFYILNTQKLDLMNDIINFINYRGLLWSLIIYFSLMIPTNMLVKLIGLGYIYIYNCP